MITTTTEIYKDKKSKKEKIITTSSCLSFKISLRQFPGEMNKSQFDWHFPCGLESSLTKQKKKKKNQTRKLISKALSFVSHFPLNMKYHIESIRKNCKCHVLIYDARYYLNMKKKRVLQSRFFFQRFSIIIHSCKK